MLRAGTANKDNSANSTCLNAVQSNTRAFGSGNMIPSGLEVRPMKLIEAEPLSDQGFTPEFSAFRSEFSSTNHEVEITEVAPEARGPEDESPSALKDKLKLAGVYQEGLTLEGFPCTEPPKFIDFSTYRQHQLLTQLSLVYKRRAEKSGKNPIEVQFCSHQNGNDHSIYASANTPEGRDFLAEELKKDRLEQIIESASKKDDQEIEPETQSAAIKIGIFPELVAQRLARNQGCEYESHSLKQAAAIRKAFFTKPIIVAKPDAQYENSKKDKTDHHAEQLAVAAIRRKTQSGNIFCSGTKFRCQACSQRLGYGHSYNEKPCSGKMFCNQCSEADCRSAMESVKNGQSTVLARAEMSRSHSPARKVGSRKRPREENSGSDSEN